MMSISYVFKNVKGLSAKGNTVLLLAIVLSFQAEAQLKLVPLERTAPQKTSSKSATARTKSTEPLKLPFWDDFSFTPLSGDSLAGYPLDSLWENSRTVSVNEGMAINAPSRNVATFDGLDSIALAYSEQLLENGFRDKLISRPIDLSDGSINKSTVYLSFFYQWWGNGEPPDANDYMRIEFKNSGKQWETALTIQTDPGFERDKFYYAIVQVNGDQFFHNQFQFRFRNYGRRSGPFDTWHIDYVYLNKDRNSNDLYFPDGALASRATGIFGPYTSMPIAHFRKSNTITPATIDVFNLRGSLVSYNYRAFANFKNYIDEETVTEHNETLVQSRGIGTNPDGSPSGAIGPLERVKILLNRSPDPGNAAQFDPDAKAIDIALKFQLLSNDVIDTLGNPAVDYAAGYVPIDFRLNDTISTTYRLDNYYAYDDGSAEQAVVLTEAGDRAAYLFEKLADTLALIGFDIYIPPYGTQGSVTGDFYIFDEHNGLPGNVKASLLSRTIKRTQVNEFQRMLIIPPVDVDEKFFIGWKAPVEALLRVGFDLNNDSGDRIFFDANGEWEQNTDLHGSLMIRPLFGDGDVVTGIPKEKTFSIFPNPNSGDFLIHGKFDALEILSLTGQPVPYTKEFQTGATRVTLNNAPSGLYILRIKQGNSLSTQKIIVR